MRRTRAIVAASLSVVFLLPPVEPVHAAEPLTPSTAQATTQPATAQAIAEPAPAALPIPESSETRGVAVAPGGGIVLNFRDASLDSVLEQLSEVAGFVIVKETRVEGRVTLLSRQPVSADDAVSLLNTVLKTNGYAAIQMGRILKIIPRDQAKKAAIPVRSGANPSNIEPSDELITQVMPIRHADAAQLRQDLMPLIGSEADVTANASSNTIIVTDTAANIRRLAQIISALDTQMAAVADVKVFQLRNASAANAARLINEVFGDSGIGASGGADGGGRNRNQNQQMPPFMRRFAGGPGGPGGPWGPGGPAAPGQPSGQEGQGARSQVRVNASSDDRTNTLVVSGPTDVLPVIERVIAELDADPTETEAVFVYNLKNGQSAKLESVINNLFGAGGTGRGGGGGGQANNPFQQRQNQGTGGSGARQNPFGGGGAGQGRTGGAQQTGRNSNTRTQNTNARFGGFGGGGNVSSSAQRTAAELAGQVSAVANEDTNSLLVMTSPKNWDRVREVIEELDRAVPQVLIKVLLAEVTHTNNRDLGVEFSVLNLRNSGLGQEVGTDFGLANQSGGLTARILENNLTATLRALEQVGKLDVLSRPYILASDNQLATITVGQEVPFVTNTRTTDTGQTINTIQYQDIGIILDVVPHINPDGLVIMDVAPEISALTGATVPISETLDAPVFAKRSAQSRVAIRDGQTIVIGGLMEDRKTNTIDKVPLLGDIPGLGALFRRTRTRKEKTELLIFLTPHVAAAQERLDSISNGEAQGAKLVPQAVEPGTYDDHLKAMERGSATTRAASTQPATR